jgi:hypothetical protein
VNSFQTTGALLCSHRRAQIGGIPLAELNALELDFLFAIDFDLGVHPADYAACTADLRAFAASHPIPHQLQAPSSDTEAVTGPAAGDAYFVAPALSTPTASLSTYPDRLCPDRDPADTSSAAACVSCGESDPAAAQAESAAAAAEITAGGIPAMAALAALERSGGAGAGFFGVSPPPSGPAVPAAAGTRLGGQRRMS